MTSEMHTTPTNITRTIGNKAKACAVYFDEYTSKLPLFRDVDFYYLFKAIDEINESGKDSVNSRLICSINSCYQMRLKKRKYLTPSHETTCIRDLISWCSKEYYHFIAETCTKINRRRMQFELMHHVFGYDEQIELIDELCEDIKWSIGRELMQKTSRREVKKKACADFVHFVILSFSSNMMQDKKMFAMTFNDCRFKLGENMFKSIMLKAIRDRKIIEHVDFYDDDYEKYVCCGDFDHDKSPAIDGGYIMSILDDVRQMLSKEELDIAQEANNFLFDTTD